MKLWAPLLVGLATATDCPTKCLCTDTENGIAVDCSNQQLQSLNDLILPPETSDLDLSNNEFSSVPDVNALAKLTKINLSRNKIEALLDSDFSMLPELETIDLSDNNELVYISEYSFFSLPSLQKVNFNGCSNLVWLSYRSFYDSYQLTDLILSNSGITAVPQDLLIYAPNLNNIDLKNCMISCECVNNWLESAGQVNINATCKEWKTECQPLLFPIYGNVGKLTRERGKATTLICASVGEDTRLIAPNGDYLGRKGVYKLRNPDNNNEGVYTCESTNKFGTTSYKFQLELTEPQLNVPVTPIIEDFFGNENEEVTLLEEYDSEPLISTNATSETIDLGPAFSVDFDLGDDLEAAGEAEWDRVEFGTERGDQEELSRSVRYEWRTATCPTGCSCTIDGLRAKKVACVNGDLTSQRPPADLTILDLVNTTVDLRDMSLISDSLQILKIKDTPYPALNEEDFDGGRFVSMRELRVINTGLMEISMDTFRELKHLRQLHLGQNQLVRIPAEIFENMTQLESLALNDNPLIVLDRDSFAHFEKLKKLNLIGSSLDDFPSLLTENNVELEQVWLDNNDLVVIPDFAHLPKLRSIRLSNNKIENVKPKAFSDLDNLQEIYMNDLALLTMVEENAFYNLPSLIDIELSGCRQLSFIHPSAFKDLPLLQSLNLANNALITLSPTIPQSLPSVRFLSLERNPFKCDCSIEWVRDDYTVNSAQCFQSNILTDIKETSDSFSCEPSLHMPSLRKDNIFQEFENEVVRIGCFSTSSDNVIIKSKNGEHSTDGNILSFVATRDDAGEFVCSSGELTKTFQLQIIGPEDEIYKGEITSTEEVEEESGFSITTAFHILVVLIILV